jgi:hypothetical protein
MNTHHAIGQRCWIGSCIRPQCGLGVNVWIPFCSLCVHGLELVVVSHHWKRIGWKQAFGECCSKCVPSNGTLNVILATHSVKKLFWSISFEFIFFPTLLLFNYLICTYFNYVIFLNNFFNIQFQYLIII